MIGRRKLRPFALLQKGDLLGKPRERERVRADETLRPAQPHRQRAAPARGVEPVGRILEENREREGAADAPEQIPDGLARRASFGPQAREQMRDELGVRVALQRGAFG